jgi:hypothetical protein
MPIKVTVSLKIKPWAMSVLRPIHIAQVALGFSPSLPRWSYAVSTVLSNE